MSRLLQAVMVAVAVAGFSSSCSGGDPGGATPSPAPSPSPAPAQNPCPASSLQPSSASDATAPRASKTPGGLRDPDPRGAIFDVLWNHRAASDGGRLAPLSVVTPRATADIGDVAVIQDEGDLVAPPNLFDLPSTGLRFVIAPGGGYDVIKIDPAFRTAIGNRVTLGDDDSVENNLPFGFRFYGITQSVAFVNSDGNITFSPRPLELRPQHCACWEARPASRPFLADLDPLSAARCRRGADAFTATVTRRAFRPTRLVTMQTSLLPDGTSG
jgi:hypothetical protein